MFSIKQNLWLLVFTFALSHLLTAQKKPSLRWEPGISIKNKLTEKWTTTLQLKARGQANGFGESSWNSKVNMVDARGFLSYTLYNQSRVQLGYIIRMNNPFEKEKIYERRLIQQFSFFRNYGAHRISQSFTLEERIIEKDFTGRFRYKIGDDFPLQGQNLDKGEYFFLSNIQILYSFNAFFNGLENRFSVGIGKLFSSGNKFTLDLESRYADLINSGESFILQLNSVYYINW